MSQPNEVVKDEIAQDEVSTILCVDDEANILSSLRRLLRSHGYKLLFAENGKEGLTVMEQEPVDLVISDMRMPEMDGATFLTEVSKRWPDTMRILLTGYSDIAATIEAINKAQIFKYISKPWEDNDILLSIKGALELKNIKRDRERLEKLTLSQNEELRDLNSNLEFKVKQRTSEIEQTLDMYEMANEELKNSYSSIIEVFSNLISMRYGDAAGQLRNMAEIARSMAEAMSMSDTQAQDVYHAALLKDIGLIGFSDDQLNRPVHTLDPSDKQKILQHPVVAQGMLMSLEPLQNVANLIRHQHEHIDGTGYPDGIGSTSIPLGARILCVVGDFFGLQKGIVVEDKLTPDQAIKYIHDHSNTYYDPDVVAVMPNTNADASDEQDNKNDEDNTLTANALKPGMVLASDLVSSGGLVLLHKGYVINDEVVNRITNLEQSLGETLEIHITSE